MDNDKNQNDSDNPQIENELDNRKYGEKFLPNSDNQLIPHKKLNTPLTCNQPNVNNEMSNNYNEMMNDEVIEVSMETEEENDEDPFHILNTLLSHINNKNNKMLQEKIEQKGNKLKLKYFNYNENNRIQTFFINPRTFFKFFDYRFPYDSKFISDDKSEKSLETALIHNLSFKRVIKVTFDMNLREYEARQEPMFPSNMKHQFNIAEYDYFKKFMES